LQQWDLPVLFKKESSTKFIFIIHFFHIFLFIFQNSCCTHTLYILYMALCFSSIIPVSINPLMSRIELKRRSCCFVILADKMKKKLQSHLMAFLLSPKIWDHFQLKRTFLRDHSITRKNSNELSMIVKLYIPLEYICYFILSLITNC